MNDFDRELSQRLESLRELQLYRELRRIDSPQSSRIQVDGRPMLNFSSNDYLGLANHPTLKEGAIHAVEKYGAGAGASRLVCGSLAPHHELEQALASFKGSEAALTFATGYAAALGTISALLGKDDIIIIDKLVHACVVDAARLCAAKLRVFRHNDASHLETILQWAAKQPANNSKSKRVLIVTESVFSMDGDHAPLRNIISLKEKYGAWLMLDEAHATGLYGINGRGLAEECRVDDRIEVQMGTLGKALGSSGGYICGSRKLIEYLINRARSFIFSTAPVPAVAGAAAAGIQFVQSSAGEERRKLLWLRVSELREKLKGQPDGRASAIVPVIIGEESKAVESAAFLREQGLFVPAIRYPTVPRGEARLRITVNATHSTPDIAALLQALHLLNLEPQLSHP